MTDFSMFDTYRRENTNNTGDHDYCDVDYLLRFWRAAKAEYLQPLFGDQLIMERPITYERTSDELRTDMANMLEEQHMDIMNLLNAFKRALGMDGYSYYSMPDTDAGSVCRYMANSLESANSLVENRMSIEHMLYYSRGFSSENVHSYTLDLGHGRKVQLQDGQKLTRVWGQIAKALDMADTWERIRIAHSLVLNQKKLKGTLCLSIHPLDYATASDNDNGWSSCMSWRENGCYRMGTVEMMNSPMVICAYVRSDKQHMEIDGKEWNSKKWRAWIIVNKNLILCNRHYPYHQPVFAKEACNWVADLVGKKYGWEYDDVHEDFYSYMDEVTDDNAIEIRTNYMYNDLGDTDIIGMLSVDKKHLPGYVCFSGKAECMICGAEIAPDAQGADQLECNECYCEYTCSECGCRIDSEDECYTDPRGDTICRDCYENNCCTCTNCDETIWQDEANHVYLPVYLNRGKQFIKSYHNDELRRRFRNWTGRISLPELIGTDVCLCDDCANRLHLATVDYTDRESDVDSSIDVIDTFDPTKTDMEAAFEILNPDGWCYARGYGMRHNPEDAQAIIDFWTDQWNAFKEDFVKAPQVDD